MSGLQECDEASGSRFARAAQQNREAQKSEKLRITSYTNISRFQVFVFHLSGFPYVGFRAGSGPFRPAPARGQRGEGAFVQDPASPRGLDFGVGDFGVLRHEFATCLVVEV